MSLVERCQPLSIAVALSLCLVLLGLLIASQLGMSILLIQHYPMLEQGDMVALSIVLTAVLMGAWSVLLLWLLQITNKIDNLRAWLNLAAISPKQLLLGVMALLVLDVVIELVMTRFDQLPMAFLNALLGGERWLLIMAVVLAAPIYEELVFRGLMQGSLEQALSVRMGALWGRWLAIVLSACCFALVHAQYNWYGVAAVFAIGVLFGWARCMSLWLAIVLHILNNAVALMWHLYG